MNTNENISKLEQHIAKLERKKALLKLKERKQDTRRKIQLGGLVIKAKMAGFSKDIILGALLDAKEQIEASEEAKRVFSLKGKKAFLDKE